MFLQNFTTYNEMSNLYKHFFNMVEDFGLSILPSLLHKNQFDTSRSSYVINLGITDQKVHQEKRLYICGKSALSLISTWTDTTQIQNETKTKLGKLLLFIVRRIIPSTKFKDMYLAKTSCLLLDPVKIQTLLT